MTGVAKRLKVEMTIDPNSGKYALKPTIGALDFDGQMSDSLPPLMRCRNESVW
jgi:hypothetical protein